MIASSQSDSLCSANGKMPFNNLVIQINQVRLKSGSQRCAFGRKGLIHFLLGVPHPTPPCSIFWNYTGWLTYSFELLISDKSGFLEHKCRNCWRNLGFCLSCADLPPPRLPVISCRLTRTLFFVSFQTPKTQGCYVPFVLRSCSCACSLCVEQMCLSWPALVSPDSYIVNQSSFSSINDLHYYKNLRNLWVCVTHSDCLHARICLELHVVQRPSYQYCILWIVLVIVSVPYLTLLTWLISPSRPAEINSLMVT